METHCELYVKQNNRWILEANFQTHQREEALEEAKQLGRQGHIQAVKVVREQRNPKSGLTRETTIYSTDKSKSRRDEGDEDGDGDPFADEGGGGRGGGGGGGGRRSPADDDDDDFGGPDLGASASATRAYGNFADMEVDVGGGGGGGGGGRDWADMDIPSLDQIETHAQKVRRVPVAVPRVIPAAGTAASPMGPATIALVKLFIVLALSIAIAAAVTFMFQRMGIGGFR